MATLNHANLTTYNVQELTEFFCSAFDFQVLEKRADKFAVLRNAEGFLLTLMYDKRMTQRAIPAGFTWVFCNPRSVLST